MIHCTMCLPRATACCHFQKLLEESVLVSRENFVVNLRAEVKHSYSVYSPREKELLIWRSTSWLNDY